VSAARKEFESFPEGAQSICLAALTIAAEGGKADIAKPLKGLGSGVMEIALPYRGNLSGCLCGADWRGSVGRARISEEIDPRDQDAEARNRFDFGAGETVKGDAAMKNEPLKLIRGSGNVYLDLGQDDADVKQLKALLAAEIIKTLDRDKQPGERNAYLISKNKYLRR